MRKYKSLVLSFILLLFITSVSGQSKTSKQKITRTEGVSNALALDYCIKKLWNIDSCGSMGIRDDIAFFLDSTNYLVGRKVNDIISILGQPDTLVYGDKHMYYYAVSSYELDNKCIKDADFVSSDIIVYFNKKTNLVEKVSYVNVH